MSVTLLVEQYQEYGLKFDEAMKELTKTLTGGAPQPKRVEVADNNASLALLTSMIAGSDFPGGRGH